MLTPGARERLRIAVLSSSRAPGLDYLLERDPNRGRLYEIVAFVATNPANRDLARVASAAIPAATRDIRSFYATAGTRPSDLATRRVFDSGTAALLDGVRPDLVVACGYLHILTAPLLEAYPGRIINIHDSDLPSYPGLHATRDAVCAGERATRSTVHLVTAAVDAGPALVRSWAFPTHPLVQDARRFGASDILKAYAYAQREWMMRVAWGPLLARAIVCFAEGRIGEELAPRPFAPTPAEVPLEAPALAMAG